LFEIEEGVFIGTTNEGGVSDLGTIFEVTSAGKMSTLHSFLSSGTGDRPGAGFILASDGMFYTTTASSILRVSPDRVVETIASMGSSAPLAEDLNGNLWGTTLAGGASSLGTVFKVSKSGSVSVVVEFSGNGSSNRGARPYSGLALGADGNLYGTTSSGGSLDLGTLFRLTPEGALSTLIEFSGNGSVNKGSAPYSTLVQGNDGAFYGTTRTGGANNFGTIFRYSTNEGLETLVEFSGNGLNNRGYYPVSSLTICDDGCIYGTTPAYFDGVFFRSYGTVFRFRQPDMFETLFDFGADPTDADPNAPLLFGSDGNLYGTTRSPYDPTMSKRIGQGSVYRIVLPGAPNIFSMDPVVESSTSARVSAKVNARGTSTSVSLEYGNDGLVFPNTVSLEVGISGYQTITTGERLTNLEPGGRTFFRFRATNESGETLSPVRSFLMLAEPIVTVESASSVAPSSARLNGKINGRGYDTIGGFEWGIDGNTFPNAVNANPATVQGDSLVDINADVAGLTKGTNYYYRVVATNEGGTTVSGTQSFRTLTEPVPQVGGSFALSTTSARVEGLVDPEGSDTTVVFEYGMDGENFPNSVSASQGLQSGSGSRPVSAVLTNLAQGLTYHYRLRATSDGGVGVSGTATFSMNVLSGFEQVIPGAPPESGGFLTVNLSPPGLLHGWRFVGETEWRDPRIQARGLVTGRYEIEFRPVPGYITPFPLRGDHAVEIESGAAPAIVEAFYYATGAAGSGGLSVTLKPDSITTGEGRAQWRLLGEGEEDWRDSGTPASGLVPGSYLVELKPVTNRTTPAHVSVPVVEGQTTAPTVTYFSSGDTTGIAPVPLAFETIAATEDNPFAFVGQIRSRSGLGTGFVVKPRVVATAAHVVWDEGTLSGAEGLQWIHRQHRGVHEPPPHVPRGFFILTGYDEARELENSPGSFAPQSRNRDIAALYFTDRDAAQGGYGGFLASDLEANEFLLSNANKRFAAYPIDGIANLSRGLMHATAPFNIGFSPLSFTPLGTGEPPLPEGRRLFFTTDIRSSGGASGGPLLVQFEGGAYYPAAVYLGGTSQMIVRAIDSAAVELFNRAAESSIEDNGNTGGGITHSSVTTIGGADTAAVLKVNLAPAGAVAAGARWRMGPDAPWRSSGEQAGGLSNARYILEFSAVPGYQLPAPQNVQVKGGQLKTLAFSYAPLPVPASAITLRGYERSIGNGDTSPSALDGSDFGLAAVDGGTATRSFTISNPGTAELSLGSIALGGSHPDDFSLSIPPGDSIPPGGSTTFTILFDPSAPGTRSATVSFATNVTGSNPFSFAIQGNDTTDSDSDGFTDLEEAALADLLTQFIVGQSVDLDLSFLRLGSGQILALLNLPPGLTFDPGTNRITGTITGKAATPQVEIRKLAGADLVSSVVSDFPVFTPARLTVGGARPFPATRIGRRSKPQTLVVTNTGELALIEVSVRTTGRAARDFLVTQPATNTLGSKASTSFTITFKPRAKGNRSASVTIFSNTAPMSLPLSGKGK